MNKYRITMRAQHAYGTLLSNTQDIIEASYYELDDRGNITFMKEDIENHSDGIFFQYTAVATFAAGSWEKVETVYD